MKEKKLVIFGAGGLGREIRYAALDAKKDADGATWNPVAFIVEREFKTTETVASLDVFVYEDIKKLVDDDTYFIVGVGDPALRQKMEKKLTEHIQDGMFATVIHNSSVVMGETVIEEGVFVSSNVTITVGCRIRRHTVIMQNASLGHDCDIGEFSLICPGCIFGGDSRIGKKTFMGSGVIVYPKVAVGDNCTVSAGVVVSRNLKSGWKQIRLKPNTMLLPPEGARADEK